MCELTKLPDGELKIMQAVWENTPPVTTRMVIDRLSPSKKIKTQTVLTHLDRLIARGFIRCEKVGQERRYFPLVTCEDYQQFETKRFMEQIHKNSFSSLVTALFRGKEIPEQEYQELKEWLEKEGRKP
ncbi:BlaI/MecI/CopY family transcriptional regulator [Candidatus Soleaferrea massiliensis]|uniref:BlaI/MecI/CopY family transcriptional regulator n=1 Tax=Candidatus Soleaferrea massiliensis TaxID=1470354 RepID=UPI00058CBD83|nr:BlaI/MecI/CopY family transcriptional regulator [Candidatus Soleaferrea massiliensis]